jgi:hypothetical protein
VLIVVVLVWAVERAVAGDAAAAHRVCS